MRLAPIASVTLTFFFAAVSAANSAPLCADTELVEACLNKILDNVLDADTLAAQADAADAIAAQAETTAKAQTAPSITPGTDGVLKTFLPQILSGLGFQGVKNIDGNISFELPLFASSNWDLKPSVAGVVTEPELFKPLVEKIPSAIRDARKETLNEELGDFDQVDLSFSLAYEPLLSTEHPWNRWGRNAKDYQLLLEAMLGSPVLAALTHGKPADVISDAQERTGKAIEELLVGDLGVDGGAALQAFFEAAEGEKRVLDQLANNSGDVSEKLGQLISAQPQAFVEYARAFRDELTGPDKDTYKLCFEFGLRNNVNDFLRWAAANATSDCKVQNGIPSPGCLLAYTRDASKRKAIDRSWRVALMAQYEDTHAVSFSLPDDAFDFSQTARRTWSVTAGAGRQLRNFALADVLAGGAADEDGKEQRPARIDFTAKYDLDTSRDVEEGHAYTLTFSQPLFDNSVLSLAVAYASDPAFLGEVDEHLSARLGFTIKRDKPKD